MTTGARQLSIRSTVIRWLDESKPSNIDSEQIAALEAFVRQELTRPKPVSRSYLIDILSHTEIPISRSLGGLPVDLRHRVKFASPEEAAQSLTEMQQEYETAKAAGNRERCEVVAQVMHSQATDTGLRSNGSPGEVNHLDRSIPSGCRKHKWA